MSLGELGGLLASLESEGRLDSRGFFSVDVRRLLPKLADFQMARPQDYVLKLVQGAVASGAQGLWVHCQAHALRLEFDAPPLAAHELSGLLGYIFDRDPGHAHLRHLAVGVAAALARSARWVQVESGGLRRRWTTLTSDQTALTRLKALGGGRTRFVLARPLQETADHLLDLVSRKDVYQIVTSHPKSWLPEQAVLAEAGSRCPIPLWVNRRRVNRCELGAPASSALGLLSGTLYRPDHHLAERWLYAARPSAFAWPERSRASRWDRFDTQPLPVPEPSSTGSATIVAIRLGLDRWAELRYYRDGVCVGWDRLEAGIPGLVALVSADDLEVDASQFHLVQGPGYRLRRAWVLREGLRLAHELKASQSGLPLPFRVRSALENLPEMPQG